MTWPSISGAWVASRPVRSRSLSGCVPSTSTSSRSPTRARFRRAEIRFWSAISFRRRDSFTRAGTRPARSNDVVPSSSEKVKTPTLSNSAAFDELQQSLEVLLGLAREADDEGRCGWRRRARARGSCSTMPSRLPRPVGRFMRLSTVSLACCSGMSTYLTTFSSDGHRVEDRVGERRRVGVHHADPAQAVDPPEPAQQVGEPVAHPVVEAVARRVLRHQHHLAHAPGREPLRLGHDVLDAAAAVPPAQRRDDAEGAGVVAALADLHVGEPRRRREDARRRCGRRPRSAGPAPPPPSEVASPPTARTISLHLAGPERRVDLRDLPAQLARRSAG